MWRINPDLEKRLNEMEKTLCTECINLNLCDDNFGCYEYWSEVKTIMREWRNKQ